MMTSMMTFINKPGNRSPRTTTSSKENVKKEHYRHIDEDNHEKNYNDNREHDYRNECED